jgi:hypothetical protein
MGENIMENNKVHLCDSCRNNYPDCIENIEMLFGSGKGNDNICCCNKYEPEFKYLRENKLKKQVKFLEKEVKRQKIIIKNAHNEVRQLKGRN